MFTIDIFLLLQEWTWKPMFHSVLNTGWQFDWLCFRFIYFRLRKVHKERK